MVRTILVLGAVLAVGLLEVPPLLAGRKHRRELTVVGVLLTLSLVSGLLVIAMPEGASVAKMLHYILSPLGEALLGPM